jgi:hypothetical protein
MDLSGFNETLFQKIICLFVIFNIILDEIPQIQQRLLVALWPEFFPPPPFVGVYPPVPSAPNSAIDPDGMPAFPLSAVAVVIPTAKLNK